MLDAYLYALLLIFVNRITHGPEPCSCVQPDANFTNGVNLVYYNCDNDNPATIAFPAAAPQGLLNVLESDKRTIVYVFGYLQDPRTPDVEHMMKALCHERTDNVVLLDWSKHSRGSYVSVFTRAERVGSLFARSLQLLKNSGFDVSKLYIVAHSLGAHIAGIAGKCNEFVIPRITGLDPANSVFYVAGCYLASTDAAWIDIIHTDMGVYGTVLKMGTAEYYANGGTRPQPGCQIFGIPLDKIDLCSHQTSVKLYIASRYNNLTAVECSSYESFMQNSCDMNLKTGVGYAASNVSGSFYFNTGTLLRHNTR